MHKVQWFEALLLNLPIRGIPFWLRTHLFYFQELLTPKALEPSLTLLSFTLQVQPTRNCCASIFSVYPEFDIPCNLRYYYIGPHHQHLSPRLSPQPLPISTLLPYSALSTQQPE